MKRLATTILLLLAATAALGQATSTTPAALRMGQNIEALTPGGPSTGNTNRFIAPPDAGVTCALVFSGTTRLPACLTVSSGLSIVNGALSASPVDWASIANRPAFSTVAYTADYADLTGKPTLGTAAAANLPTGGNATAGQIVLGADTRLADARTPLTHGHAVSDVSGLQAALDGKLTTVTSAQVTSALGFTPASTSQVAAKYTTPTGTTSQYVRGDGTLASMPVVPTVNRTRAVTAADGTYVWTLPTACSAAPIVSIAPEVATADAVFFRVVSATATTVTVAVAKASGLTVGALQVLGLPAATSLALHLIAACP